MSGLYKLLDEAQVKLGPMRAETLKRFETLDGAQGQVAPAVRRHLTHLDV
jgi:hypothetical protein